MIWQLLDGVLVLISSIVVHEAGHYLARRMFGYTAFVTIGVGPVLFRLGAWTFRLWPISGVTTGQPYCTWMIPFAGPFMNFVYAVAILFVSHSLLAIVAFSGTLSIIPARVKGYPTDGLLCLQQILNKRRDKYC
jgi:hypothetical protein